MALDHLKSAALTSLDAIPRVPVTAGKGVQGAVKSVEAAVALTASGNQLSTYQFVRIPFSSIVKKVEFHSPSQGTTGIFDIGAYYATDKSNALSKTELVAADAIDADFFIDGADAGGQAVFAIGLPGAQLTVTGATAAIGANTAWTAAEGNQPLWQALGLTENPGGNCDIAGTLTDEAAGTGAATAFLRVEYVDA